MPGIPESLLQALADRYTIERELGHGGNDVVGLRRAADTGLPCYPWFRRDPLLGPLRSDPDFQRWLADLQHEWESAKRRYTS